MALLACCSTTTNPEQTPAKSAAGSFAAAPRCSEGVVMRVGETCDFMLVEPFPSPHEVCHSLVSLDGSVLPCNAPDGWHALGLVRIRLDGAACAEVSAQDSARVEVSTPCDPLDL
jgi:hypothetical protein